MHPMFKITYYILRQLTFATACIAIALTGAIWLTQSLRFVNVVINKGLPVTVFFELVAFLLPDLVCVVLPGALLIAVIYVYNRIAADNELIIMRSIGMSNWQIAKPTIIIAITITTLLYCITLYVLPHAFRNFKDMEHQIRNTLSAAMLQAGEFNTFKNITIYIRARESNNKISGIILHDSRNPQKPYTTTAERGSLIETNAGLRIILANGIRHEINPKTGNPSMLYFDQHILDLASKEIIKGHRYRKPHEYFLIDLLNPDDSISPQQKPKFISEGHQRIITPMHVLAFALLGVSILLQGEFNRRRRSKRIVFAVVTCCCLQITTLGLINLSERTLLTLPMAYTLVLIAICVSLALLLSPWLNSAPKPQG